MSADLLRRAAAKLREHAEKATPGPWVAARDEESMIWDLRTEAPTEWQWQKDIFSVHTPDPSWPDIDYCATVHPPVALALADWLDSHVGQLANTTDLRYADSPSDTEHALAVARAVLREDGT